MNIRILSSAYNDLVAGKKFYDRQSEGLGEYFLDTLFSDIDSLILHGLFGEFLTVGRILKILKNF